mgnify:CR=1 FL=1
MEAPDLERGWVQPYPSTPRKRWTPVRCGVGAWIVTTISIAAVIIVEIVVLLGPGLRPVDGIVYNRVIAMIGGGLTACLSLTGLVIARAELSSKQRGAALCGVILCLSPVLVIVMVYNVLGAGAAEWLFGWK